jgi:hypothetical protein
MAELPNQYPLYDPSQADLLVCPLSGKPILRAKAGGDVYVRSQEILQAVEQVLERGSAKVKIWVAKDKA